MRTISFFRKDAWILDPGRDLLLFVLPPLLIAPAFMALSRHVAPATLALYVLGLGGFGHHLPGFIRAYADRGLFARNRWRLTGVPIALLALSGLYAALDLRALVFATVAWGTWHGAMQIHGFMRIYDAKAGSIDAATARLDRLMCIAWFGWAIARSPDRQYSLATLFYGSGGPLLPPAAFAALGRAWDLGTIAVTVSFAAHAWRRARAGAPPSPAKSLVMASGFGFWWFCVAGLGNPLLGVLMWEVFHDLQYNALVWLFQRRRAGTDPRAGAAERFLFGRGPGRFALYAALIVAYGAIGVATSFADVQTPADGSSDGAAPAWLLSLVSISALLHFYYDGFIWRLRESRIREDLGISAEGPPPIAAQGIASGAPAPGRHGSGALPGWGWAGFVLPVAWMGFAQHTGRAPDIARQAVNLAEAIPGSATAAFLAGTWYKDQGRPEEAEAEYRKAARLRPGFAAGHLFLGDVLYKRGAFGEAAEAYAQAVSLDPDNLDAAKNLANLYLRLDRPWLAEERFAHCLAAHPDDAELEYGMASSLLRQNRLAEAEPFVEKALALGPSHSGALNCAGMIRDLRGDASGAAEFYRRALEADSGNASARENLRALLAGREIPEASR